MYAMNYGLVNFYEEVRVLREQKAEIEEEKEAIRIEKEATKQLSEMTAGLNTSSDEEDGFEAHPALDGTEEDAREALREELSKLETDIAIV